jgi:predicted lipid-binding transport protein (Tim44 family)
MKVSTVLLAATLAFGALDADAARRLGGGGSFGRQSPNVTQRQATPPATPATPNSVQPQRSPTAQPGAAAAAQQPARSRMGGILGGLAAGLGLAWLANARGFGEAFGQFLMFALLAVVIMVVIGIIRARRHQAAAPGAGRYAYQGAGSSADAPASPRQYNPAKVGNDASARPWESTFGADQPPPPPAGTGIRIGSGLGSQQDALSGSQNWGVPPGFDVDGFLTAAKRNFTTLQSAWDRGDMDTLRSMMTDEMLGEIRNQIAERDREGATQQRTEVEMLEAQLLGIEELATEYMASVEFSGMIREEPSAGPTPFREVWNMVKPKSGSAGWLVAGVQALQ